MQEIKYGRKRSGIKHELKLKIDDWVKTIEDENVRKLAEKNVIITGGCIASMLLGEKVNDYDVYFRNKETTLAVAKYYVEKFIDKNKILSENNVPVIKELTKKNIKGVSEDRVVICVGSSGVASEESGPYSYFETLDPDKTHEFTDHMLTTSNAKDYRPIFLSENAITLSGEIQLVVRFYGEPDKIHDNYDFVHAKCYYDYNEDKLVLPAEALEALLSRTLVYQGSLYPICSVFRTKKFLQRGWRITAGQQLKMMWQISELDLTDKELLKEQLIGVDAVYMWQLIRLLKEVDPSKIDSAYVSNLIDTIFD